MAITFMRIRHRTRAVTAKEAAAAVQYLTREGVYAPKGKAVGDYLTRQGAFGSRDDLRHVETFRLPGWAQGSAEVFFMASERYERSGGRWATTLQYALPRELSREQQVALSREFIERTLGKKAGVWVLHEPLASDGLPQPHIHILFCQRTLDGIERGPQQFFRRFNPAHPELGGAQKDRAFAAWGSAKRLRIEWCNTANTHLARAGLAVTLTPHAAQGKMQSVESLTKEAERLQQELMDLRQHRARLDVELLRHGHYATWGKVPTPAMQARSTRLLAQGEALGAALEEDEERTQGVQYDAGRDTYGW
jgi:hypothetical protein